MSILTMLVWVLAVVAVVLGLAAVRLYVKKDFPENEAQAPNPLAWLPPELHYARILAVEEDMHCRVEVPGYGFIRIFGRPDQVYQLPNGLCVPLEFKNRNRPRPEKTDADQLTLQAWMLRRHGYQTAPFGVVVFRLWGTEKRHAVVVPLAGDVYALYLLQRYLDISTGAAAPTKANDGRCDACGHAGVCHA